MRHPAAISHGLLIATTMLFWVAASAARLQADGASAAEPASVATVAAAPERAVLTPADLKLADHVGKVVVLDFWASWCEPCKLSMPWLSQLQRKYAKQGLQIVAISVDTDEKAMRTRLGEIDPGIIVVFDPKGQLAEQYELEGMPMTYLIDRVGKQVGSHVGYVEAQAAEREAEIAKLLREGK
jgi:thiol-disulfide isomerase/thioredoxin